MATGTMSAAGREEHLEGKVEFLEQRLAVLERFVEMRFCETFRDFAVRSQTDGAGGSRDDQSFSKNTTRRSNEDDLGEEDVDATTGGQRYSLRRKQPTSKPSKSATVSTELSGKEVRISIRRLDSDSNGSTGGGTRGRPSTPATGGKGQNIVEEVKGEGEQDHISDAGEADGDYFTFSGDDANDPDANPLAPDDTSSSSATSSDSEQNTEGQRSRKKRKKPNPRSGSPTSFSRKYVEPAPEGFKTCELCQRNIREDLFPQHMKDWHSRERHLKCRFCPKRFFAKLRLQRHEKTHELKKVGKPCRVENCSRKEILFKDAYEVLKHERFCIRQELEAGRRVDEGLMEDVWRRSKRGKNVPLKWPGEEELVKNWTREPERKSVLRVGLSEEQVKAMMRLATKSGDGKWKCSVCESMISNRHHLRRHLTNVHGKQGKGGAEEMREEQNSNKTTAGNQEDQQIECPDELPT